MIDFGLNKNPVNHVVEHERKFMNESERDELREYASTLKALLMDLIVCVDTIVVRTPWSVRSKWDLDALENARKALGIRQ